MTLRSRIVLICVAVTVSMVSIAGFTLVRSVSNDLRDSLDADLASVGENFTPLIVNGLASDVANLERREELLGGNPTRGIFRDRIVFHLGRVPDVAFAPGPGFDDVEYASENWRRFTLRVRRAREVVNVEVFSSLAPIEARIVFLRNRAIVVGAVATALAAALGAALARAVTRPLRRLRDEANEIQTAEDLDRRLDVGTSSVEVDEVASVLNNMLDRLEVESGKTRRSLEAARAFASDATHELRTPLTAVANNVEILLRHPELPAEERKEILEEITERQASVTQVLGALRDLARGDLPVREQWQEVDLGEIADTAMASMPSDDTVRVELSAEGEHLLDGWPDGLRILIDNLLSNAASHGRALDGRVRIKVSVASSADHVVLSVADSGLGIAAADSERLQQRYERGDSASGGTGLGLAMVRQQVDLHAGRLTIGRSSMGGAEMIVRLPKRPRE